MTQSGTHNEIGGLHGQVQVLRELIQQIEGERDDLRRHLDSADEARQRAEQAQGKAFAELSRLTLLLTHQPKLEPESEPQPRQAANQNPRRAFKGWTLAGLVVLLAINRSPCHGVALETARLSEARYGRNALSA